MAKVENYIAAVRNFVNNGDFKSANEAMDSLKDYLDGKKAEDKQKEVYNSLVDDVDNSPIVNPSHYQSYNPQINIDCITAMRAAFGDEEVAIFCKLNAFKYNWRADSKGKNVDIGKAIWYLNKYLELNK